MEAAEPEKVIPKPRPLAPRGGNDQVMTPPALAKRIVEHFAPSGMCLDPCSGEGAFFNALCDRENVGAIKCELTEGSDFFQLSHSWLAGRYDSELRWIVTNPPWSQFRAFLKHSMALSENVVFLSLLNAWFMKARVRDMRKSGFGLVEILMLETPPKPWPQTGFQLAAVHVRRGYDGPVKVTYP